jgi:hypothetical protein
MFIPKLCHIAVSAGLKVVDIVWAWHISRCEPKIGIN